MNDPHRNNLARYAVTEANSRGRRYPEESPAYRGEFQRDRDRIVHSAAFRRLEYKTQVFVNHEGDLYRTRLTHSLEVAQIGRTVARALRLNEDLVEAICLAHDLGHTPFGHAGQEALNRCMQEYGGFEHNLQSLRVVDELEERYATFPGLNLTYESREGILKHCSAKNAAALGRLGKRFLDKHQPSLEAQIANISDEIAYNNHDVDDGLRSGLLDLEVLQENRLFGEQFARVRARYPGAGVRRLIHESVRHTIDFVVTDLIDASRDRVVSAGLESVADVRAADAPLIGFSASVRDRHIELKRLLREHLYRHYRVLRMTTKAQRVVDSLFRAFFADPRLLPPDYQAQLRTPSGPGIADQSETRRARTVADYIAGMTDRYAIAEYERLTDPRQSG